MPGFRIGAPDLPAKDVAYIRALVRLFAYTEKINWTYVDKSPYTALLAATPADAGRATTSLTLIMLDKLHPPHTIAYPIRADQLRDWLKRMSESLKIHAVAPPFQAERPPAPEDGALDIHARFKLRRWPAPALLNNDLLRVRMATLMSRRAVNVAELAGLAAASPQQATAFLEQLRQAGLLAASVAPAAPVAEAAVRSSFGIGSLTTGLLDNIRRRIGIT